MDIYCVRCGEPWDMDELHYRAEETDTDYRTVRAQFYSLGCEAMGATKCERQGPLSDDGRRLSNSAAMSVLVDIMGDDVDGIASMMEDYRLW